MTTAPPDAVIQHLARLDAALDAGIPARTEDNILAATGNIRAFGSLTEKWAAGPRDAHWMRTRAHRPNGWNHNLMVLGGFNLDRIGDPLFEAFVATGLWPPTERDAVPRTIFNDENANHFYDQIAWFSEPDGTPLLQDMAYTRRAGPSTSSPTS